MIAFFLLAIFLRNLKEDQPNDELSNSVMCRVVEPPRVQIETGSKLTPSTSLLLVVFNDCVRRADSLSLASACAGM